MELALDAVIDASTHGFGLFRFGVRGEHVHSRVACLDDVARLIQTPP